MMYRGIRFALLGLALLLFAGTAAAAGHLEIGEGYELARIWKTVKKAHFIQGKLPLKNVGSETLANVEAVVIILDPAGKRIDESKRLRFGSLAPGKTEAKPFVIEKGVQFSELQVLITFRVDGKDVKEEFTSPDFTKPTPLVIDTAEGAHGVRLLSHEIDAPVRGGTPTLTCRVRNIGGLAAKRPTVTITFKLPEKSGRASGRKPRKKTKKDGNAAGRTETMAVVLEEGEIPPGETKVYEKIKLKKAPEFVGYAIALSADFPEVGGASLTLDGYEGGDETIRIHDMKTTATKDGNAVIAFKVTNKEADLPPGSFTVLFWLYDKAGKEVAHFKHAVQEALPKDKSVAVTMRARALPAYAAYEIGFEFDVPETPAQQVVIELKEDEKPPEGFEVIEVPAEDAENEAE